MSHDYIWSGDRLLAEVTEDYILKFFYDASGNVLGFEYLTPITDANGNTDYIGTTYYYEKNIFGDVVAIYDENGTKVGAYGFNSFGQNNVVTDLTDDNIASLNPIRYRSYYYDTDIYLYYLQSRYYDPVTCRFINADAYASTGQGLLGNNMFAYCGNNPVTNIDPTGFAWYNVVWDWFNTLQGSANSLSTLTALGSLAVAAVEGRWDDIKSDWDNGCLNPFNQSEETALKSKVLGFYKGSTIVRHNFGGTFSIFGTIWAESNIDEEVLKHEFGHSVQERFMGAAYGYKIAIPSVIYYWYDYATDAPPSDYYSMPWERTADWFGGVQRECGYKQGSLAWGIAENLLGPIVIPFYFLFGY